jgi:hypothetical protein
MEHTSGVFQNARLRSCDGPFYSEEDAAVGKTDRTTMLKLVPFVRHTDAANNLIGTGLKFRQIAQSK